MPNVTLYLAAALVFVVALGAAGYKGYSLGADSVRAEYAARDLKAAADAAAKTQELQEKYRAIEQAQAQEISKVAHDYERRLTDAKAKTTVALDAIRSGSVRLRDNYAAGNEAGRGCPAGSPAPAGVGDGKAGAELSPELANFLVSEASRADAYTEQLTACQRVIEADRR